MRAINHAVTGATIGLAVPAPALAMLLAYASHFLLDAIPHYDDRERFPLHSKGFAAILLLDMILCFLLILGLIIIAPSNWLVPAVCAFLATSADLMWIGKFKTAREINHESEELPKNPVLRFHSVIQWRTGPSGLAVELVWLAAGVYLIFAFTA